MWPAHPSYPSSLASRPGLECGLRPPPVQVRPPERMALPKKLRPPLHAFIRHLLRDVLAQDTLQHVGVPPTRCKEHVTKRSALALNIQSLLGCHVHASSCWWSRLVEMPHEMPSWAGTHVASRHVHLFKQVLRKLRKLPWADNEWYLVRALLSATRGRAGAAPLVASLAAGLSRWVLL